MRAAQLKRKASIETADLPRVRLPYRLWRAPALEFMVNAGATYSAGNGVRLDRSMAIAGAGEIAAMSYSFRVSGNGQRPVETVRAKLYRSDPDANLLGPLKATHFAVGDVEGARSDFGGGSAVGRGVVVTNEPLNHRSQLRPHRVQRRASAGLGRRAVPQRTAWSPSPTAPPATASIASTTSSCSMARIASKSCSTGRRARSSGGWRRSPSARTMSRRGQLWYWAGVRQPNTPLLSFDKPAAAADGLLADSRTPSKAPEVAFEARYGVSSDCRSARWCARSRCRTSACPMSRARCAIRSAAALGEIAAARDSRGGTALRAQLATKIGPVNINAATQWSNGFAASTDEAGTAIKAEHRLGARRCRSSSAR